MKKLLVAIFATIFATAAQGERPLEAVMQISADAAEALLGDVGEEVLFVSSEHAERLLGDDGNPMDIQSLNNLPATAAGKEEIIYISPAAANALLGDAPN